MKDIDLLADSPSKKKSRMTDWDALMEAPPKKKLASKKKKSKRRKGTLNQADDTDVTSSVAGLNILNRNNSDEDEEEMNLQQLMKAKTE